MVAGIVALATRCAQAQHGTSVDFDASFLPGGAAMNVDLSRFRRGNAILPGFYEVDLWLNDEWQARRSVRFVEHAPGSDAVPCLSRVELEAMGLAASRVPGNDDPCEALAARIPGALARFDLAEQRLDVEMPQALLTRRRRGIPPRDQWHHGIAAGLLGWRINLQDTSSRGTHRRSVFLADDAGFNAGRWRWRHSGAMSNRRYRPAQSFVQHPFDKANAWWRAGDLSLSGDLFEPLRVRGVQLASDARMASHGTTAYTPVVRGIASRRARVRVLQGDVLLRELSVPAGPFVLDDLPASAQGGDLVVDIDEEGGRHRQMRMPYSPMPDMLPEGDHRFAVIAGRSKVVSRRDAPLLQALWRQGLSHGVTLYAGHRWSRGDRTLAAGTSFDTCYGGISLEGTRATGRDGSRSASLWRARYGASRRASLFSLGITHGAVRHGEHARPGARPPHLRHARGRRVDALYQRSLGQGSGVIGASFSYLSSSGEAPVGDAGLTWSHVWRSVALDVSLRRRYGAVSGKRPGNAEGQLSVSVPLGHAEGSAQARFAWRAAGKDATWQAGVTGATADDAGWAYATSVATGRAASGQLDASASHASGSGDIGVALSRSTGASSASLAASGAAVVHRGGLTLAPRLGEAMGLVHARHAAGARLAASGAGHIDRHGYAVLPALAPYRWNSVDIDPTGLPLGVTFSATPARVVPTAGAVLLLPFETEAHPTVLIVGHVPGGDPLPFGAELIDARGRSMGFVGQGGRALVRWEESPLPITVRWSGAGNGGCVLSRTSFRPRGGLDEHEGDCR
jgi:outer membrane usher protein